MHKPLRHQSYENLRKGLPAYHSFLTPVIGDADRRRQLRLPAGLPQIGSFRLANQNYEKREVESGAIIWSLAMDEAFRFMSVAELRAEDYYLLRVAPIGSELFNSVSDSHETPPFNCTLHASVSPLALQQPDFNRPWPAPLNSPLKPNGPNLPVNPFSQSGNLSPNSLNFPSNPLNPSNAGTNVNFGNFSNNFGFQGSGSPQGGPTVPKPPSLLSSSQCGQFQTPLDRLAHIIPNSNTQLISPAKNFQENSFARHNLPNAFQKAPESHSIVNNSPFSNNSSFPNSNSTQSNNFFQNSSSFPSNSSFQSNGFFQNSNNSFPSSNSGTSNLPSSNNNRHSIRSSLDYFLEFFYDELVLAYNQGHHLRALLEEQIHRCFVYSERMQQAKEQRGTGGGCSPAAGKKHRECVEIKGLMDGLRLDLEGKAARGESTPELTRYAQLVWNVLQEIYNQRLGEEYLESRGSTTEEAAKDLSEKLLEKEGTLMFRIGQLDRKAQSPAKRSQNQCTPNSSLPFAASDPSRERDHLAYQVFMINQLNSRLKELCQRERLEREDHLYDCVRRREEPEEVGEYQAYCRRKRGDEAEVMVVVIREPEKKDQSTASSQRPRTARSKLLSTPTTPARALIRNSPIVSEFEPVSPKSQEIYTVSFKATVIWTDSHRADEAFKAFEGSFQLPEPIRRVNIESYLTSQMQACCWGFLRRDAEFRFSDLRKQRGGFDISLKIRQQKLNIPAPYTFEAKFVAQDSSGQRLAALTIGNAFGRIEWGRVDVTGFDFCRGELEIGDNTVLCSCDCLNLPARITFFSLPKKVDELEERYFHGEIEEKLRKHVRKFMDMELESIDWGKHHYTITAKEFFTAEKEEGEEEGLRAKRAEARREGEGMSVREFTMTESAVIA